MSKDPLQSFQKLNDLTHLYKPPSTSSATSSDPGLVVLCSWAFAQVRHISKYLRGYQERYPHTCVLLVQVNTGNVLWRPDGWQMPMFHPAVLAIKEHIQTSSNPGLLLHVFSNGGSHTAVQLAQAYRESCTASEKSNNFPVDAILFDSCPSPPRYQLGVKAVSMGLPKTAAAQFFGVPAIYVTLGFLVVLHVTGIAELFLAKADRELNERPFLREDVPRTYIYSKSDAVIVEKDILGHADDAKAKLKESPRTGMIRTEEFVGSQHVNHVSKDPERYWTIVGETWGHAVKVK